MCDLVNLVFKKCTGKYIFLSIYQYIFINQCKTEKSSNMISKRVIQHKVYYIDIQQFYRKMLSTCISSKTFLSTLKRAHVIWNLKYTDYSEYIVIASTHFQENKSRVVTQYHYTTWPDHGTPDPLSLVVFHRHVMRTRANQNEVPVVVHCRQVDAN